MRTGPRERPGNPSKARFLHAIGIIAPNVARYHGNEWPGSALFALADSDLGEAETGEGLALMWISLFTFAAAAAVCLSVAAVLMQPAGRTIRGL